MFLAPAVLRELHDSLPTLAGQQLSLDKVTPAIFSVVDAADIRAQHLGTVMESDVTAPRQPLIYFTTEPAQLFCRV